MSLRSFLVVIAVTAFLAGCRDGGRDPGSFTFGDLSISYPSGMEISREEEVPEKKFVSFFLSDKEDRDTRMEFGISEFPENFLATVPQEELKGELAAMVERMREDYCTLPGISVLEKSEIQWSEPPSRPEAFSFAKVQEGEKVYYLAFSALVVGHYSLSTIGRSSDPSRLDDLNNILESTTSTQ